MKQFKKCSRCLRHKPLDSFHKHRNKKDGRTGWCKSCACKSSSQWRKANPKKARAAQRRWLVANPDKKRAIVYKAKYGLSQVEYENILESQLGVCAICHGPPTGKYRVLQVDHNHATGAIRGLLCKACNTAIGCLKDKPTLCDSAAEYLRLHE